MTKLSNILKVCNMCGDLFKPDGNMKTCSWECRQAARLIRYRKANPHLVVFYQWTYEGGVSYTSEPKKKVINKTKCS